MGRRSLAAGRGVKNQASEHPAVTKWWRHHLVVDGCHRRIPDRRLRARVGDVPAPRLDRRSSQAFLANAIIASAEVCCCDRRMVRAIRSDASAHVGLSRLKSLQAFFVRW